jgi:DCN1-like protein 1/2
MEEDQLGTGMERARVRPFTSSPTPFTSPALHPLLIGTDSVESFEGMKTSIPRLRKKLGSDPDYFRRVYLYTFEFARSEGQRSLGIELAQAFWNLLIPFGLKGGALRMQDYGGNDSPKASGGWTDDHTQLWYEFLKEKNIKGISKDTWAMARAISFFL